MTEPGRVPSPDLIVAESLGTNMPLRMSPLGLAQEALRALREAGYELLLMRGLPPERKVEFDD